MDRSTRLHLFLQSTPCSFKGLQMVLGPLSQYCSPVWIQCVSGRLDKRCWGLIWFLISIQMAETLEQHGIMQLWFFISRLRNNAIKFPYEHPNTHLFFQSCGGDWSPSSAYVGWEMGFSLEGSPGHCRTTTKKTGQSTIWRHTPLWATLEWLMYTLVLELRGKTEYPEKHGDSLQTDLRPPQWATSW